MKGLDHGSDVAVLENPAAPFSCFSNYDIHHGPGQVVGPNHPYSVRTEMGSAADSPEKLLVSVTTAVIE